MSTASNQETIASVMGDLATPAGQADPYPIYARMRELGEAVAAPDGTVVVTGYRACSTVIRDNRLRKSPGARLSAAGSRSGSSTRRRRTVELVDAIAVPFPVAVIGELLGIPAADRATFQPLVREWTSVLEFLNSTGRRPSGRGGPRAATVPR